MRCFNFIVLMSEDVILSDEPIEHRLLMAKRGIEWQDVLVTGRINFHDVSFRSSDALDRREVTEDYLLEVQRRVRKELLPFVEVLRNSPENEQYCRHWKK